LFVLKKILQTNGYQVTALSDGNRVLNAIGLSVPDLIILDINLGETDGRTICEEIKNTPAYRHIPILLYSAEQYMDAAIANCQADAFIKKPFSKNLLLEKIGQFIAA